MKVNIFEGGRRILKFVMIFAALSTISLKALDTPYVGLTFNIPQPGAAPIMTETNCPEGAAREYIDRKTSAGKTVHLTLCFLPLLSTDNHLLIPYKPAEQAGYFLLAGPYSSEVKSYTDQVARSFFIPSYYDETITKIVRDKRISEFAFAMGALLASLAMAWVLFAALGWIVRGFLGIPRGHDFRPDGTSSD